MSPYNKAAWEGTKPLVAPLPTTFDVDSVCWEKGRDEPGDSVRRGGFVVARTVDPDTGEFAVKVLQNSKASGRLELHVVEIDGNDLDSRDVQPPEASRNHRIARLLCSYVGGRGGYVRGFDRWCVELAMSLLLRADDIPGGKE